MTSTARPPPLLLIIYRPNGSGYSDYLTGSGFRVAEAHTGGEGIDRANPLAPDLIVLDFDLNSDLVTRLRGHELTRAIPIIALAALSSLRDRADTEPPESPAS